MVLIRNENILLKKIGLTLLRQKLVEYYKQGKALQFPESALSILLYTVKNSPDFEVQKHLILIFLQMFLGPER